MRELLSGAVSANLVEVEGCAGGWGRLGYVLGTPHGVQGRYLCSYERNSTCSDSGYSGLDAFLDTYGYVPPGLELSA